jgi:hypothetical protein
MWQAGQPEQSPLQPIWLKSFCHAMTVLDKSLKNGHPYMTSCNLTIFKPPLTNHHAQWLSQNP